MTEKRTNLNNSYSASHLLVELENVCFITNVEEDVLFPYMVKHLQDYLGKQWLNETFQQDLKAFREEIKALDEKCFENFFAELKDEVTDKENILKCINWQLENKKVTDSLKKLQRSICEEGFKTGDLKVKLNNNVQSCIKSWSLDEKQIYAISCYPIALQKLMLVNTDQGDILPFFKDLFDEEIGSKTEKDTFAQIVEKIGCDSSDLIFITSDVKNATASSASNLSTLLLPLDSAQQEDYAKLSVNIIHSLTEIEFTSNAKKRKVRILVSPELIINREEQNDVEMVDVSGDKMNGEEGKSKSEPDCVVSEDKAEKHLGGGDSEGMCVDAKVVENIESSDVENAETNPNLANAKENPLASQNESVEKQSEENMNADENNTKNSPSNVEKEVNVDSHKNEIQTETVKDTKVEAQTIVDVSSNVHDGLKSNGDVSNLAKEETEINDSSSDETNNLKTEKEDKVSNEDEKSEVSSNLNPPLKTENVNKEENEQSQTSEGVSHDLKSEIVTTKQEAEDSQITEKVRGDFNTESVASKEEHMDSQTSKDVGANENDDPSTGKIANEEKEICKNGAHDLKTEKVTNDLEKKDEPSSVNSTTNECNEKLLNDSEKVVKQTIEDDTVNNVQAEDGDKIEVTPMNNDLKSSDNLSNHQSTTNEAENVKVNGSDTEQPKAENDEIAKAESAQSEKNIAKENINGVEAKEVNGVVNGKCNGSAFDLKNSEGELKNETEAKNGNCDKTDEESVKTETATLNKIENGKCDSITTETIGTNEENGKIEEKKLLEKNQLTNDMVVDNEIKS